MSIEINSFAACGAMLLYNLLKVPVQEIGNIIGDCFRDYRLKNLEEISKKHLRNIEKRHLAKEDLRVVSLKIGLPLLNEASLETDETLQEIWAKLLTNAADPNFKDEIRVAFIDVIKTFTPVEAKILSFCNKNMNLSENMHPFSALTVTIDRKKLLNELNIDEVTCNVALGNLERCQIFFRPALIRNPDRKIIENLTTFGLAFIKACISDNFISDVPVLNV